MGCSSSDKNAGNSIKETTEGIYNYRFERLLGQGNYGKVMLSYNILDKTRSKKMAIKAMKLNKVQDMLKIIKRETAILQSIDHPNIVKYFETRYGEKYVYIIMEYCSGGDLFTKIKKYDHFGEPEAARIMEKLIKAIAHCHANGITHRDIKPENIMYTSEDVDSEIKLIDFGLSQAPNENNPRGGGVHSQGKKISRKGTKVGTPYYVAPEVLTGFYNCACDIWSLGVIMYLLLTGYFPCGGTETAEILQNIQTFPILYTKQIFGNVSEAAIDLCKSMLNRTESKRLTAIECLEHEWFDMFKSEQEEEYKLDPLVMERIKQYEGNTGLQKEVMNVLVKNLHDSEIIRLKEQFRILDEDNSGYINTRELKEALSKVGSQLSNVEVEEIVEKIDYYGNHKINYSEFIAATLDTQKFLTKEKLWILFKHFDTDNSGVLTKDNIKETLAFAGKEVTDLEVRKMIADHDTLKNGTLSFKEFKAMMMQLTLPIKQEHLEQISNI